MAKVAGVRVELNQGGIMEILKSAAVQADLLSRAEQIAEAAGGADDFAPSSRVVGGSSKLGRAMGYVTTATPRARALEARDRALTRAIDAGRG